jgi:hypothetical protein
MTIDGFSPSQILLEYPVSLTYRGVFSFGIIGCRKLTEEIHQKGPDRIDQEFCHRLGFSDAVFPGLVSFFLCSFITPNVLFNDIDANNIVGDLSDLIE